jgi:hypothetical protein
VAYWETPIAFSVYYRADDPQMSGKMDQFYTKALAAYNNIRYPKFHKYNIRNLDNWYRLFPFKKNDIAAEDDSLSCEEGDFVDVPAVDASQVGRSFNMSDGEEDEAEEADNVAAVKAAEARLADGAPAGRTAVAAAGAGEVASAAAAGSQA